MNQNNTVEIALSKSKLVKGLAGSLLFVAASVWLLTLDPSSGGRLLANPLIRYGIAVSGLLFFGWLTVLYFFKLRDGRPGLVIDSNGILDNSGGLAAGFIPWSDIEKLSIEKVMKQQFLVVTVRNPQHYIDKQKSIFRKKGMQYNLNNYGSPIAISTNTLNCKLPELLRWIEERKR